MGLFSPPLWALRRLGFAKDEVSRVLTTSELNGDLRGLGGWLPGPPPPSPPCRPPLPSAGPLGPPAGSKLGREEETTFAVGLEKEARGLNSMGFFYLQAVGPQAGSVHTLDLSFLACEMGDEETFL